MSTKKLIVRDNMDPCNYPCRYDRETPRAFYMTAIEAATTSDSETVASCTAWATNIQLQAAELVLLLTANQDMQRDYEREERNKGNDVALDFLLEDSEYNELVTFITSLSAGVGDMARRLRVTRDDLQKANYHAN